MLALHRRALLTAFAASAVFGRFRAFAANVGAKISAVVNAVTAQPKEGTAAPTPVAEGQDLPPGTIIATGPKSGAELTYADGAVLVIGQRSTATLAIDDTADTLTKGAFRFRGAATANALLTTPSLRIEARSAEFVVAVAEGQTICGVVAGEITCTSIKKGTAAKVAAGESVAWVSGSFGAGVTKGIFQTGDLMVDRGLEAARADWRPVAEPPPAPQ